MRRKSLLVVVVVVVEVVLVPIPIVVPVHIRIISQRMVNVNHQSSMKSLETILIFISFSFARLSRLPFSSNWIELSRDVARDLSLLFLVREGQTRRMDHRWSRGEKQLIAFFRCLFERGEEEEEELFTRIHRKQLKINRNGTKERNSRLCTQKLDLIGDHVQHSDRF